MAISRNKSGRQRTERRNMQQQLTRTCRITSKIEDTYGEENGIWYETPECVQAQLDWGQQKAVLMRWVRRQMERRLTLRERRSVELYYLEERSYREIAIMLNTTPSTACRLVRDGIRRLRAAAAQNNLRVRRRWK